MEPLHPSLVDEGRIADAGLVQRMWLKRTCIILVAIATVYAGTTLWIGWDGWHVAFSAIAGRDILIIILLVLIGFLLRAGRWHYYIYLIGWDAPLLHSFVAFVASIALTATPAKSGELAKVVLLRNQYRVSLSQGAGVLLIERLGDLIAVVVLAIGGLTLFTDLSRYVVASTLLIGAVAFMSMRSHMLLARAQAVPKLRAISSKLMNMLDAAKVLLRPMPLVAGGSIALVAWSCEALAFCYLVGRLNIHSSLLISFSIYGLSTLAGALSMLPGGIGGFEAVMAFLLTRLGIAAPVATVAVVIFRLCTLWLFSLVGVIFMLAWTIFISNSRPAKFAVEVQ
jgi:uncharacterized protein (TIRG00374 family)